SRLRGLPRRRSGLRCRRPHAQPYRRPRARPGRSLDAEGARCAVHAVSRALDEVPSVRYECARPPGAAMKVKARFITSAAEPKQFPPEGLPEVAVVGRSNVGK